MRAPVPSSRLYPLFADLRGRTVLVVGGGVVSRRKVESLRDTGARIVVGAPQLDPVLAIWASTGELTHRQGPFHSAWLEGTGPDRVWLVIAATDDADINRAVAEACEACGIWVNVVDDTDNARFHVPALIQRGPLQIAISSGGGAPMLARLLRESLEKQIDGSYGALAELLTRKREQIRNRWPALRDRRRGYARLLAGPLQALLRKGNHLAAERAFDVALKSTADTPTPTTGSVVLVGAGPGDPGLLTLRALRAMNEADVILHDRLVSADVLQLARRDAERIEVGKQAGNHHVTQEQINALLVEHALAGRRVVRLKGGDPFVFGRGGEELEVLQTHGIAFEVVPGITAAIACAAYAGIPLTHRDHAQSLHIVTAHCKASLDTLDWPALAQSRQTLAVYMGVGMLGTLQARLLAQGLAATTPFALIENGSRPDQRIVTGTLDELAGRATTHAVQSPALLIMGEVAAFANRLHWFGPPPLAGESSPAPANTLALAVAA